MSSNVEDKHSPDKEIIVSSRQLLSRHHILEILNMLLHFLLLQDVYRTDADWIINVNLPTPNFGVFKGTHIFRRRTTTLTSIIYFFITQASQIWLLFFIKNRKINSAERNLHSRKLLTAPEEVCSTYFSYRSMLHFCCVFLYCHLFYVYLTEWDRMMLAHQ